MTNPELPANSQLS